MLAPLIPQRSKGAEAALMDDVLKFIQAFAHPISLARLDALTPLASAGGPMASSSALWRATLRSLGRWDEAIDTLRDLSEKLEDRLLLYRYQLAVTCRTARLFRECQELLPTLTPTQQRHMRAFLRWRHGDPTAAPDALQSRIEASTSRQFEVELWGTWLIAAHHAGIVTMDDADRVLAIALGASHPSSASAALAVRAQMRLYNEALVRECIEEFDLIEAGRGSTGPNGALLLALRGWATDSPADLSDAQARCSSRPARASNWMGVDCLLDHLGYPVPPVEGTTLLEPADVVRDRWVAVCTRIIERAAD